MLTTCSVIGFIGNTAIVNYLSRGILTQGFLFAEDIDSSKMPVTSKCKIGMNLVVDVLEDGRICHKSLLPSFSEQLENLKVCRYDSLYGVVRFSNSAGSVVEFSTNIFGFAYNLVAKPGSRVLAGILRIDTASESIKCEIESVYYDIPLQNDFSFVYRDNLLPVLTPNAA